MTETASMTETPVSPTTTIDETKNDGVGVTGTHSVAETRTNEPGENDRSHGDDSNACAKETRGRYVAVVNFLFSLILLLGGGICIILSLVGPKHAHGLSIMYIEPIDMDGPSIWVGVAQTCSRAHDGEPIVCTPSAKDQTHGAIVTESLQAVLQGVNGQGIAMAFLVLSMLFNVIAIVVLLMPIYRSRGRALRSGHELCPHGIIIVFGLVACTWSAIAALVEHCVVPKALSAWNEANGRAVGLSIHGGAVYYRKSLLFDPKNLKADGVSVVVVVPIIQLFALFFAYRSMRIESYHDAKAKAFAEREARRRAKSSPTLPGKVEIVHRANISPLWVETILDTGYRLDNGKTVYWVGSPTSVNSSLPPGSPGSDSFLSDGDVGRVSASEVGCAV